MVGKFRAKVRANYLREVLYCSAVYCTVLYCTIQRVLYSIVVSRERIVLYTVLYCKEK